MLASLKLFGIGIIMGIANVIPGVSGGTIAVVFNVYDRLLAVITPQIRKILAQWKFLLPLGFGIVVGVLFFAKLVSFLFINHPAPTRCFFIGIIVGSLPVIYRKLCPAPARFPRFSALACAVVTLGVMIVMVLVKPVEDAALTNTMTVPFFFFLMVAGILSAVAMIIPGISGSFLLLALGLYQTIIGAAGSLVDAAFAILRKHLNTEDIAGVLAPPLMTLLPVVIGVVIGLFCGAALVRFLLCHIPRQTYGAIFGLVAGSIAVIAPGGMNSATSIVLSLVSLFAGAAFSFLFARTGIQE
ncbi:MAG: DUF368 domain-containing protein [Spirochaetaceae bacterium]|jgi:putative membrane protein|nr:DUF368 domain-containing protein [Spirochaetaceae bacterium]